MPCSAACNPSPNVVDFGFPEPTWFGAALVRMTLPRRSSATVRGSQRDEHSGSPGVQLHRCFVLGPETDRPDEQTAPDGCAAVAMQRGRVTSLAAKLGWHSYFRNTRPEIGIQRGFWAFVATRSSCSSQWIGALETGVTYSEIATVFTFGARLGGLPSAHHRAQGS
jgi:hypothetical protein